MQDAVRTIVVYIPKDAPAEYAAAHSHLYLPKSQSAAARKYPGGYRRVLVTIHIEDLP